VYLDNTNSSMKGPRRDLHCVNSWAIQSRTPPSTFLLLGAAALAHGDSLHSAATVCHHRFLLVIELQLAVLAMSSISACPRTYLQSVHASCRTAVTQPEQNPHSEGRHQAGPEYLLCWT
jgi:hypothetical protein